MVGFGVSVPGTNFAHLRNSFVENSMLGVALVVFKKTSPLAICFPVGYRRWMIGFKVPVPGSNFFHLRNSFVESSTLGAAVVV